MKNEIKEILSKEKEVNKIVIFGSFLKSDHPNDIDIAIFQDSDESYLQLAMKYRRLTRPIARKIAIDIIPIKSNAADSWFLSEIKAGELIYER
ncbi:MAG: nucleotidyltransferase domain-containing protein [bacterium]|nr:nucleotidyltransferase domain-containing protein [bacterium]